MANADPSNDLECDTIAALPVTDQDLLNSASTRKSGAPAAVRRSLVVWSVLVLVALGLATSCRSQEEARPTPASEEVSPEPQAIDAAPEAVSVGDTAERRVVVGCPCPNLEDSWEEIVTIAGPNDFVPLLAESVTTTCGPDLPKGLRASVQRLHDPATPTPGFTGAEAQETREAFERMCPAGATVLKELKALPERERAAMLYRRCELSRLELATQLEFQRGSSLQEVMVAAQLFHYLTNRGCPTAPVRQAARALGGIHPQLEGFLSLRGAHSRLLLHENITPPLSTSQMPTGTAPQLLVDDEAVTLDGAPVGSMSAGGVTHLGEVLARVAHDEVLLVIDRGVPFERVSALLGAAREAELSVFLGVVESSGLRDGVRPAPRAELEGGKLVRLPLAAPPKEVALELHIRESGVFVIRDGEPVAGDDSCEATICPSEMEARWFGGYHALLEARRNGATGVLLRFEASAPLSEIVRWLDLARDLRVGKHPVGAPPANAEALLDSTVALGGELALFPDAALGPPLAPVGAND